MVGLASFTSLPTPTRIAVLVCILSLVTPIVQWIWGKISSHRESQRLLAVPFTDLIQSKEHPKGVPSLNTELLQAFRKAQATLQWYGTDRLHKQMKDADFWDDKGNLKKCIFSKILAGRIPQPSFVAAEQAALGDDLGSKYMVAANAPESDDHWNDASIKYRGNASMSQRHRFLLIRPQENQEYRWWFNVLVFGMDGNRQEAVEVLKEMKTAALKMTKAGKSPTKWSSNIGLFFVIYGHTTCTGPLHILDMASTGPSYDANKYKLLSIEDVILSLNDTSNE